MADPLNCAKILSSSRVGPDSMSIVKNGQSFIKGQYNIEHVTVQIEFFHEALKMENSEIEPEGRKESVH